MMDLVSREQTYFEYSTVHVHGWVELKFSD